MTSYDQVVKRFGKRPQVDVFSPTEYRVWITGWHVHNGAATSDPVGQGRSLEKACEALLRYVDAPASMLVKGDCDVRCYAKYSQSESHQKAARDGIRAILEENAATVESWPAWKRGLPPCADEECEREDGHKGKHRRAKPVEYDEW